jgi:hypothetical protein
VKKAKGVKEAEKMGKAVNRTLRVDSEFVSVSNYLLFTNNYSLPLKEEP